MAAGNWMSQVFNFLTGAQYSTSPTPIAQNSSGPVLCDSLGRLRVVPSVGALAASETLTNGTRCGTLWSGPSVSSASGVVSAVPASLFHVEAENYGNAARWLQIFNIAVPPTNGNAMVMQWYLPAIGNPGSRLQVELPRGFPCTVGIAWGVSTTKDTYAADANALVWSSWESG